MMAKPKRTLALIKWFDASYQRGECTKDEFVTRVELESAGILVQENADTISIALDRYAGDDTYRHIEHIPKVNVLSVRRIVL